MSTRPGGVAAAGLLIGGAVVVVLPSYAPHVVQLVILTAVAAAGLHALAANVPEWSLTGWATSPFHRRPPAGRERRPPRELERIRAGFSGRRHPVDGGPELPPRVVRLLKPLVRMALEQEGLDPDDPVDREVARARLEPLSRAVLESRAGGWPPWLHRRRPNERRVAEIVHDLLDELERLRAAEPGLEPSRKLHQPETT